MSAGTFPALSFLDEALAQAEETAARLKNELWWVGDAAFIDVQLADGKQVEDVWINGRKVTVTNAIQHGLLAANPTDLERRVAKTREILAAHPPRTRLVPGVGLLSRAYAREGSKEVVCGGCGGNIPSGLPLAAIAYPCTTVTLLAESWGWTQP